MKPPFFNNNELLDLGVCALGSDLEVLATRHDQWAWVDEGSGEVHKYGYVSTEVRGCHVMAGRCGAVMWWRGGVGLSCGGGEVRGCHVVAGRCGAVMWWRGGVGLSCGGGEV